MIERPSHWYLDPLWWLVILFGIPAGLTGLLLLWALVDRTPPLHYAGLADGSYDPAARVLTLQWKIHRNRYCAGTLVRTIEADIGGTITLPSVAIDPYNDPPEIQAARRGTVYVGRVNLIEIPKTLGGAVRVTSTLRFWCNPVQFFLPIVVQSPTVSFAVLNPESEVQGSQPVTVGPPPE